MADPSAGGVAWHTASMGLPTSWSCETEDARVEIAEIYGAASEAKAREVIARAFGQDPGPFKAFSVSTYPAWTVSLGANHAVAIAASTRLWVVVGRTKNARAGSQIQEVFASLRVSRDGKPNWALRPMGNSGMATYLPFELAPDAAAPAEERRSDYEMTYNDLEVALTVQKSAQGMRFDIKSQTSKEIDGRKKDPQKYKNLKAERTKLKGFDAEVVNFTYEAFGRKMYEAYICALNKGDALQIRVTGYDESALHTDYIQRILHHLDVAKSSLGGFRSYDFPEGMSLELPKAPEQTKNGAGLKEWEAFTGGLVATVRIAENDGGGRGNRAEIAKLMEMRFRGYPEGKDFKTTTEQIFVGGLEATLLKVRFKYKSFTNEQWGVIIPVEERTYVLELLSSEGENAQKQRIVDSIRFRFAMPDTLKEKSVPGMVYRFYTLPETSVDKIAGNASVLENYRASISFPGEFGVDFTAMRVANREVMPGKPLIDEMIKLIGNEHKAKFKKVSEGNSFVEDAKMSWQWFEMTLNGNTVPGAIVALVRGDEVLTIFMTYSDKVDAAHRLRDYLLANLRAN